MTLFQLFGIGDKKILAKGCCVPGAVIMVRNSALYVVKKPVRLYPNERNTRFSHWITFQYCVNGITYTGKRWVSLRYRCPQPGEQIDVCYDPEDPKKYACWAFGPAVDPIGW